MFGGQLQASSGSSVDLANVAYHHPYGGAAEGFFHAPQDVAVIANPDDDQLPRREPRLFQPRPIESVVGAISADNPQSWPVNLSAQAPGQSSGESQKRAGESIHATGQVMKAGQRKPPVGKGGVNFWHAKG